MALFIPGANARINHAIQFAVIAHGNQVRKGNEDVPYVFHCIDVANEVMYYSGLKGEELEIATMLSLLHDTEEDTAVTIKNIREQFGEIIAKGVGALSKDGSIVNANPDSKLAQLKESIARVKLEPVYVQVVKLGDRISNLKNFPAMWSREKIQNYLDESAYIARELGSASEGLHARLLSRIVEARVMLSLFSGVVH